MLTVVTWAMCLEQKEHNNVLLSTDLPPGSKPSLHPRRVMIFEVNSALFVRTVI